MTVINGIESEELKVRKSDIKAAIANNDKIEDKLHVVMVISNPCGFKRRWQLAKRFQLHMGEFDDVELYCVELVYGDQKFMVTQEGNAKHLRLRTDTSPIWSKESMIEVAFKQLLPENWKAAGWVDADVEFESPTWASDTLKILNGCKDVVQPFSHVLDLDKDGNTMQMFHGFGFQHETGKKYCGRGVNFMHPGYACCFTRKHYEKVGIFQHAILGSADNNMMLSIIGATGASPGLHPEYVRMLEEFKNKNKFVRLGYVPGIIVHQFHGKKKNRGYDTRWRILVKYQYNPYEHTTVDEQGLIVPSDKCPQEMLADIRKYFGERNEDEGFNFKA